MFLDINGCPLNIFHSQLLKGKSWVDGWLYVLEDHQQVVPPVDLEKSLEYSTLEINAVEQQNV